MRLFTKRRIILTIFISWIFAPAALTPVFFFCDGGFGWHPTHTLCVFKIQCFSPEQKNYMLVSCFDSIGVLIVVIFRPSISVTFRWQHCARFDRPEIRTLDLPLQRRTRYRSTNQPVSVANRLIVFP